MTERQFDLTRPFIAIRRDDEGPDYEPTMGEYLCNPLDEDIFDVEVSTGGFYSDPEIGVIEGSDNGEKPTFTVPAGGAVQFALSTWEEYQEMVLHWTVRYRTNSLPLATYGFGTFKRLEDCKRLENVPCLGGPGQVVPQ